MPLSRNFDSALVYAANLHRNQTRREAGFPTSLIYWASRAGLSSRAAPKFKPLQAFSTMPPRTKVGRRHWTTSKSASGLSSAGSLPIARIPGSNLNRLGVRGKKRISHRYRRNRHNRCSSRWQTRSTMQRRSFKTTASSAMLSGAASPAAARVRSGTIDRSAIFSQERSLAGLQANFRALCLSFQLISCDS